MRSPILKETSARARILTAVLLSALALLLPGISVGQQPATNAVQAFSAALHQIATIFQARGDGSNRTFTTTVKIAKLEGMATGLAGQEIALDVQAPDRLRVSVDWQDRKYLAGRDGESLWLHIPEKHFALVGSPGVQKFAASPDSKDTTPMGPLRLPIPPEQLMLLPLLMDFEPLASGSVGDAPCHVLKATAKPEAVSGLKLPQGLFQFWVRKSDFLPVRLAYGADGGKVEIEFKDPQFKSQASPDQWKLPASTQDKIESVARSHLTRFMSVAIDMLGARIPVLGPATGEHRVVAREGAGRLEDWDGTRVLVLKGTPEEMGRQHGLLLKKPVKRLVDHMLFGVGVGSSFEKGSWVFGEIEKAQERVSRFVDERYLREMDALASAAGLPSEEVRLANFFPEMFHCSGFAVFGKATMDGSLYHGRILDYLRGMGLEQNAVVMVFQPDRGNAWVNVGYAGFIGSVTAMNERQVAIGEMGGGGQGQWDGKPMAQLVREVMEKANTLDEAVDIMRKGPRTCEYYYVISDAKSRRAVGIAATPDKFQVIQPGQSHPLLPHAIPDAVVLSAGGRYEELARRVQEQYGKLDAQGARDLMKRPVCMNSNIHCALFAPDTLDFWVANADSENVAAHARYTHYNLATLLKAEQTP